MNLRTFKTTIYDMIEKDFGNNPALHLPIHNECCAHCPSRPGFEPDPETQDYMRMPKSLRMKTRFPCAWRPEKLCKGYNDRMEKGTD